MPVTAAILLLVGATWSVVSRKLRPLVLAEATVLSVVALVDAAVVRARPWHGSAARGSGVRRLACATPLTQRLTFAVAEVDGLFVAEDDRADRRSSPITLGLPNPRRDVLLTCRWVFLVHDYLGKRQPSDSGKEPPIPAVVARREMVERAAADDGAEECLEPPRRADEKQAVSDITPSPGSRRPSADATQHIETDTAPDDDEPHPVGFGARARSERAEQDDGEDSSAPGRAKPLEMRLDQFCRLSVSGGAPGSPIAACHPVAAIRRCRSR